MIYQVRSQIKGFKLITKWFQMNNQGNFLQQNLKITPDQLIKIVCFIHNPATSVVQKLDAIKLSASKAGEAGIVPITPLHPLCARLQEQEKLRLR